VRHPRRPEAIFETVAVSGAALCTSGDYERGEHVLDPRRAGGRVRVCSASVIAPTAMAADALATAAMVLAPAAGLRLLEREQVAGLIVTADLQRFATANWPGTA
jgi:thiamine biosynthesis lipoprotein